VEVEVANADTFSSKSYAFGDQGGSGKARRGLRTIPETTVPVKIRILYSNRKQLLHDKFPKSHRVVAAEPLPEEIDDPS
jgi:hypothetical protein